MALTTDPTPRLTPAEVLQDEHRMKRLKAALCDGLFSYADDQTAARIMDEATKICGGSTETLSELLQTRFFMQYTPFHWIIANRPPTNPGAPPLLVRFVHITDTLRQETQEEIMSILGQRYDSGVYTALRDKLTGVPRHEVCNPTFFDDPADQPMVTSHTESPFSTRDFETFSFRIPKFFDRLVVEEEVWMEFQARGALVRLRAAKCGDHSFCDVWLRMSHLRLYPAIDAVTLVLSLAGPSMSDYYRNTADMPHEKLAEVHLCLMRNMPPQNLYW